MDALTQLFGGSLPDLADIVETHDDHIDLRLEHVLDVTPIGDFPSDEAAELYQHCFQRFAQLHAMSTALSGVPALQTRVRPRDVPGVLVSHFSNSLHGIMNLMTSPHATFAGRAPTRAEFNAAVPLDVLQSDWMGLSATPFYLTAEMADAVLSSEPPNASMRLDMRLPVRRAAIVLGAPFLVDPAGGWWTEADIADAAERDRFAKDALTELGYGDSLPGNSIRTSFLNGGGYITGVVLSADRDGLLEDHVIWMLAFRRGDDDVFVSVPGRISRSLLAPILHNLAAAVCWAPWTEPSAIPEMTTDAMSRFVRSAEFRRMAKHPEKLGIHLVRERTSRSANDRASGKSPAPHLRRGHWRSVRVAHRDEHGVLVGDVAGEHGQDWHYEGRWIAPTFVNAGSTRETPVQIFAIPERSLFTAAIDAADRATEPATA